MEPTLQHPSSAGSLDQDAVNLAKAFRQQESGGNFRAKGKSGEYGAYQYLPETWNQRAKKYGINVPLEKATPEQQNEVQYRWIKEKKDQGFNIGQIASMHNAGEGRPNAYIEGHKGVNKHGASYDVSKYAKDVATLYQGFKTGNQPSTIHSDSTSVNDSNKKSIGGFLGNTLQSGANLVGGLYNSIRHPLNTLENLGNIGIGAVEKLIPGEQGQEKYADAVGQFYKERYGGVKNIGETLYNDPLGAAADASMLLSGGGALLGKAGKASELAEAARAGSLTLKEASALQGTSAASRAGALATRAGEAINPLAVPGKMLGKVGRILKGSSTKSYEDALAATTKADKYLTEPVTRGRDVTLPTGEKYRVKGLIDRGVVGSHSKLEDVAESGLRSTGEAMNTLEKKIPKGTQLELKPIIDDIFEAKKQFTVDGANGPVIADTQAVKALDDFANTITAAAADGMISNESLTQLKRIWQAKVAQSGAYYGKTLSEGSQIDMMSVAEKAIRKQLDTKFPDLAKLNAEYKFWKDAEKVIKDTIERRKGQSGNFSKIGYGTMGAVMGSAGGILTSGAGALAMEGVKMAVQSTAWKTASSILKDRLANAIANERVGEINSIVKSLGVPIERLNEARR